MYHPYLLSLYKLAPGHCTFISYRVLAAMVLGITLFSPSLILLTPEHHCLIKANVTEDSPSQNGSCYLQYPSEVNVSYNSGCYNSLDKINFNLA